MGQHHVLDRQVGDLADAADYIGGHRGRGLRVGNEYRVVADDDAGVWVALGGVGPGVLRELREGDFLLFEIGLAGELFRLAHRDSSQRSGLIWHLA